MPPHHHLLLPTTTFTSTTTTTTTTIQTITNQRRFSIYCTTPRNSITIFSRCSKSKLRSILTSPRFIPASGPLSRLSTHTRYLHTTRVIMASLEEQWPALKVRETFLDYFKERGHTFGIFLFFSNKILVKSLIVVISPIILCSAPLRPHPSFRKCWHEPV
jgi:hypothetical protein